MNCPECDSEMVVVNVKIQDANSLVTSYQCPGCDYFNFEKQIIERAISEIKAKQHKHN